MASTRRPSTAPGDPDRLLVDVVNVEVARIDEFPTPAGAHPLDQARFRGMDVEEARACVSNVRERVHDARRNEDGGPGATPHRLVADAELELSLEDVERVRVPLVEVCPRALVVGAELE